MRLLTSSEAAALLRTTRATVAAMARRGALPGIRLDSGHWRFRLCDLDAYLERRRPSAPRRSPETAARPRAAAYLPFHPSTEGR